MPGNKTFDNLPFDNICKFEHELEPLTEKTKAWLLANPQYLEEQRYLKKVSDLIIQRLLLLIPNYEKKITNIAIFLGTI